MPGKLNALIQKAASLSGGTDILAQIETACNTGRAGLFYTADGNGVIALKLVWDEDGTAGIWIWFAASTGGHLTAEGFTELCTLAHRANARFIAFRTKRPGLIRKACSLFGFIRQPDDTDGFMVARYWLSEYTEPVQITDEPKTKE